MIGKIIWESFSVLLVLYGLYLTYVFIWFSLYRIGIMNLTSAKLLAAIVSITILAISSVKWFIKKHKELKEQENRL